MSIELAVSIILVALAIHFCLTAWLIVHAVYTIIEYMGGNNGN